MANRQQEEEQQQQRVSEAMLDELLAGRDAREVYDSGDLFRDLKKALVERILDAEMDVHLEGERARGESNRRNGHNRKRVLSGDGEMELEAPRDRDGTFEPLFVERYRRRLPGFDERVISLYAKGLSTREIGKEILEAYGVEVSAELVSRVTDAVHDEIREWQSRPLEEVYALVYLDAIRVKMRDEGIVRNKAVYLAIGVTCRGHREVLGMWIERTEGARFWLGVLNEIKSRGVKDILIAVVDGLTGFPEAIGTAFPETVVQGCVVHLVRASLARVSYKDRRPVASALREIYGAATVEQAEAALDEFESGEWSEKYPAVARSWRTNWERVIPFLAFSENVRRAVYTTNQIESLNSSLRRAVRRRGHFPGDDSARKLLYLALRDIESRWKGPPAYWPEARREFAIQFGERFRLLD